MAHEDLINRMIATYRDLNLLLRPMPESQLAGRVNGEASIRDHIQRMRDNELRFTQSIKEQLTGQTIPDDLPDETPTLGMEHEGDPTRVLLSQLGTARESTLAMLREMDQSQWESTSGGKSITQRIQGLLENDQQVMERVQALARVPARA